MAWFRAEHEILQAAIAFATEQGFNSYGWQIPWARRRSFPSWGTGRNGQSPSRPRWPPRSAWARPPGKLTPALASASRWNGSADIRKATCSSAGPRKIYRQLGDAAGEANTHMAGAVTRFGQAEVAAALSHAQQALGYSSGPATGPGRLGR